MDVDERTEIIYSKDKKKIPCLVHEICSGAVVI